MKRLRERKPMPDHGLPCWRAAGSKAFDSRPAAMEETEASLTCFSLLTKNGAGFVSQNGVMCAAVWPQERRRGWKGW